MEALAKIEKLKTPVARRGAVEAACARLSEPAREQLLLQAARLEVDAVLDKVETLKTRAAKERNLAAALQQLRSDPVPDELQRREIEMLETALADLDRN